MAVRKRGLVSLSQEETQQGMVRGKMATVNDAILCRLCRVVHCLPSYCYFFIVLVTVVIDAYTHNSVLTSGDSVPLGTQLILACQVVGLPYGTPLDYTWTCPNGPCEVEGYYGRKIYNEHILAVNTTSTNDGGTYTCQVTAKGVQQVNGNFTLNVTGMPFTTLP